MSEAAAAVPVITIDGPSGSGKGTVAARLARQLGWHLLDSGALYRVVAAVALRRGLDLADGDALGRMAAGLSIEFAGGTLLVDGEDFTLEIRSEPVSKAASQVAAQQPVRDAILDLQHGFRKPPGLVADGRDMGTVVFPDAPLKIYLDASVQVRAERRYAQLTGQGLPADLDALRWNLEERDARDKGRALSPLKPAAGALVIDSTSLGVDEVLEMVLVAARGRGLTGASQR